MSHSTGGVPSSLSTPMGSCPKHTTSMTNSCSTCYAWAAIEKERKRLALCEQRLDLDKELFKNEKRNRRRTNLLQTQAIHSQQEQHQQKSPSTINKDATTSTTHPSSSMMSSSSNSSSSQQKNKYESELEELKTRYLQEQEDNKIKNLEWKLKMRLQDTNMEQQEGKWMEQEEAFQKLQQQNQELQHQHEELKKQQQKQKEGQETLHQAQRVAPSPTSSAQHDQQLQQRHDKEVADLHQQMDSLRDQVMRMNILLANSSKEQIQQKQYAEELQEKLDRALMENETYSKLSDDRQDYSEDLQDVNDKLEQAQMENETYARENQEFILRCKEYEEQLNDHQEKLTRTIMEKEEYIKQMDELTVMCKELEGHVGMHTETMERTLQENGIYVKQIDELAIKCKELEDQLNERNDQLERTVDENETSAAQNEELSASCKELEEQATLNHVKLEQARMEIETYVNQNDELNARCKELEEEADKYSEKLEQACLEKEHFPRKNEELRVMCEKLEEQKRLHHDTALRADGHDDDDDDDDDDGTYITKAVDQNGCSKCEHLEEEVYDLKLKLNKCRIEHAHELDALTNQVNQNPTMMAPSTEREVIIETVGTSTAAALPKDSGKPAKQLQQERKSETDVLKANMKLLALAAKQETADRERRMLEQELEEAKRNTYQLAVELDQLQKDHDDEKDEHAMAPALDDEQLSNLMHHIDRLQQSQETYATRHEEYAQEWTGLVESLTKKQRQAFDMSLPSIDTKITSLKQHVNELEVKIESASTTFEQSTAGDNGVQNRGHVSRTKPLTTVDSRMNRYVTGFKFVSTELSGLFTGFLNAMNLPEGHGVLQETNGDVYDGEWQNGLRHGCGVYSTYDGDLYNGPWVTGKRHGRGVFIYADGQLYDGEYNMDHKEGNGMLLWPRQSKYEGSFKNDKRNGQGEYQYPDGRVYRGEYKDDRQHGYGVETSREGIVRFDGYWALGEFIGDGDGSVAPSLLDPAGR